MSSNPLRPILTVLLLVSLVGCSSMRGRQCEGNQDYLAAVDRPRLQLPPEITPSERVAPLAIPQADPNPNRLDPEPACLDEPPSFFSRKGAAVDPAEEAVRSWAAAWAARKPDAVIAAYSPSFEPSGTEGSGPWLEQRREQVSTGRVPEAKLEDVTVAAAGADRRVVTFVQRFGDGAVRKELTLVREGTSWRIVSERTIEVL
jgi:hypothetical protein